MTKKRQEGAKPATKIFSAIFFLAGLAVLALVGISLGKETYRKKQIQKEIEGLQTEIQKMNQENSELSNLISYFSSREFQEKEAREKLNLQKEDEKMIVLRKEIEAQKVEESSAPEQNDQAATDQSPNWQKWLRFFFK
jgi:cell division protein FtsB